MKKLAVFAIAVMFAAAAMASGIFTNETYTSSTITIGGKVFNLTEFSTSGDNPTSLDTLSDLTISGIAFNAWSDTWDNSAPAGGNVYLQLWGGNASSLDNGGLYDQWMQDDVTFTHLGDGHDYRLEYNKAFNPNTEDSTTGSKAWGIELQDNQTYYMDVWFKAYGDGGDVMLPDGATADGNGTKFHTSFTYQTPQVPEPATMSLLGLGALAMVLRRKLRK